MRIGIVNDMLSAREGIRRAIVSHGVDQVAWAARDGSEAVKLCAEDLPDLILMDLIMPGMDGVQATREIMRQTPCPILVVTSSIDANMSKVYQAMGAGALDAVATPSVSPTSAESAPFFAKLDLMRRLAGSPKKSSPPPFRQINPSAKRPPLVSVGSSAGGPFALSRFLRGFPSNFPGCIAIVQHVDRQFVSGLATWLAGEIGREVKLVREYDTPQPGTILLAGEDRHLFLTPDQQFEYHEEPAEYIHKPSVDIFFESVAKNWRGTSVGVILTGMGKDGARGLHALRSKGHLTIAQDRASSAVYGMPKAAAELNAAKKILPLEQIAPEIVRHLETLEK